MAVRPRIAKKRLLSSILALLLMGGTVPLPAAADIIVVSDGNEEDETQAGIVIGGTEESESAEESDRVEETEFVEESEWVEETEFVEESEWVEETEFVEESEWVEETEFVEESEWVEETEFVEESEWSEEIIFVEESDLVEETEPVEEPEFIDETELLPETDPAEETNVPETDTAESDETASPEDSAITAHSGALYHEEDDSYTLEDGATYYLPIAYGPEDTAQLLKLRYLSDNGTISDVTYSFDGVGNMGQTYVDLYSARGYSGEYSTYKIYPRIGGKQATFTAAVMTLNVIKSNGTLPFRINLHVLSAYPRFDSVPDYVEYDLSDYGSEETLDFTLTTTVDLKSGGYHLEVISANESNVTLTTNKTSHMGSVTSKEIGTEAYTIAIVNDEGYVFDTCTVTVRIDCSHPTVQWVPVKDVSLPTGTTYGKRTMKCGACGHTDSSKDLKLISYTLDQTASALKEKDTLQLTATILPVQAASDAFAGVEWSIASANLSYLTVNPTTGLLTALKANDAPIPVSTSLTLPPHLRSAYAVVEPDDTVCEVTVLAGVEYSFDRSTGTLTFSGNAPIPDLVSSDEGEWFNDPAFSAAWVKHIIIEDSITAIGNRAFDGMTNLTSVYLGSGLERIGHYAFRGTGLTSVSVPPSVNDLGNGVFNGCTSLKELTIPASVTHIGSDLLMNANTSSMIVTVDFGSTAHNYIKEEYPDIDARNRCDFNGTGGYLTDDHTVWWKLNGSTLTIGGTGAIPDFASAGGTPWVSKASVITTLVVENGITSIGTYAFGGLNLLRSATIPSTVTRIGASAFRGCASLSIISFKSGTVLTAIGDNAFRNCTSLSAITIPGTSIDFGTTVFTGCTKLSIAYVDIHSTAADYMAEYYPSVECIVKRGSLSSAVTWTLKADGVLYISGTGTIPSYSLGNPAPWYADYRDTVTSAVIDSGITSIGAYAFFNMKGLESISFVSNTVLSTIGRYAFSGSGLKSIVIPDSVTTVSAYAFYNCNALTFVDFEEDSAVGVIEQQAFANCPVLTKLYLPEYIRTLGFNLLYNSDSVTVTVHRDSYAHAQAVQNGWTYKIYIPYTLQNGVLTLNGTGEMTDFASPSEAPWYGERNSITKVVIGKGNTTIGSNAFQNYPKLATLTFEEGSALKTIGEAAFAFTKIKSVTFPASVETIGVKAFTSCSALTSVAFEGDSALASIGNYAFRDCTALASMFIPENATAGTYILYGVTGTSVTVYEDSDAHVKALTGKLSNKTLNIVLYDLAGSCGTDAKWTIKNNVLTITGSGDMAKAPASSQKANVTKIVISKDITSICANAFRGMTKVIEVAFEDGSVLESIGKNAFYGCTSLTKITLPNSVVTIDDYAFYSNTALKYVVIDGENSALASIGTYAFSGCTALKTITIPEETAVGTYILNGVSGTVVTVYKDSPAHKTPLSKGTLTFTVLSSSYIGENAKWSIENGVLTISGSGDTYDFSTTSVPYASRRSEVTRIVIGKDITSVGNFLFYKMTNAASVVFEEGTVLSRIGEGAFGYTGITNLVVPASVSTVEKNAFYYCPALRIVSFEEGSVCSSIGNYAFRSCPSLYSIFLPDRLVTMGASIFYQSSGVNLRVALGSVAQAYAKAGGLNAGNYIGTYCGFCGISATWVLAADGTLYINGSGDMDNYTVTASSAPWGTYKAGVTKVVVGKNITSVGAYAFYGMKNLTEVSFEGNSTLTSIGESAFGQTTSLGTVTLPASLKTLGDKAFQYSGVTDVSFDDNSKLATMGKFVFRNCMSLQSVYIPAKITSIGDKILYAASSSAKLHVSMNSLGQTYASSNGYGMVVREETLSGSCGANAAWTLTPDGTLTISGTGSLKVFGTSYKSVPWGTNRAYIKKVIIGKGITDITNFAFYNCTALESVTFESGSALKSIGTSPFSYTALRSVTIPASVASIGKNAFAFNENLTSVGFESNSVLTELGNYAFRNCPALESIYFPASLKTIGSVVLYNPGGSKAKVSVSLGTPSYRYAANMNYTMTLRDTILTGSCGTGATWTFNYTKGTLTITGSGAMKDYAYSSASANAAPWATTMRDLRKFVTSIIIGANITSVGDYAFCNMSAVKSVTFNSNVNLKTIGEGAFGRSGIETITIPASVTAIEKNAFYYSKSLTTVNFKTGSKLATVGNYAFRDCTALVTCFIPSGAALGSAVFYNCPKLSDCPPLPDVERSETD